MTRSRINPDFGASPLGTQDYWQKAYERECVNYKSHQEEGECWFGEDAAVKMVDWICKYGPNQENRILDVGCGNGHLLVYLYEAGFHHLTGCDYAKEYFGLAAIELASSICAAKLSENHGIQLKCLDILNDLDLEQQLGMFDIVVDKGTLDAISLSPSEEENITDVEAIDKYVESMRKLLPSGGILLITSCNWVEAELLKIFENGFSFESRIKYPVFKFGGVSGQKITTVAFKRQ